MIYRVDRSYYDYQHQLYHKAMHIVEQDQEGSHVFAHSGMRSRPDFYHRDPMYPRKPKEELI
jgi:hypothetical protein